MTITVRCPVHGIPDCSPILNGCSRLTAEYFICPRCGAKSYNPNDVRFGYCGRCHDWTGDTDK